MHVPAPTSRSSGCCSRQPVRGPERRQLENQILKGHAASRQRDAAGRAARGSDFNVLLEVHRDERPMHAFQLPQHRGRRPTAADVARRDASAPPSRNAWAPSDSVPRRVRIDALQPQQPVLEVPRQRLDRHAGRQRLDHRRAEPDTAARRRRPPAPTRRSARRNSSTVAERFAGSCRPRSGDRTVSA